MKSESYSLQSPFFFFYGVPCLRSVSGALWRRSAVIDFFFFFTDYLTVSMSLTSLWNSLFHSPAKQSTATVLHFSFLFVRARVLLSYSNTPISPVHTRLTLLRRSRIPLFVFFFLFLYLLPISLYFDVVLAALFSSTLSFFASSLVASP